MVSLVVIVLIAQDVPLSANLARIERDRLITAIQRDVFTIGGEVNQLMNDPVADRSDEIIAVIDDYSRRSNGTVVVADGKGYLVASNDPNAVASPVPNTRA